MALQTSGAISFQDLQDEFGGSHPITMYEYAANRTSGTGGYGVAISLSDFYGATASTAISLTIGSSGSLYGFRISSFGSVSPTTYNSVAIRGIYTSQSKSIYTLFVIFSGNRASSFFSSILINGNTYSTSYSGHSYNSSTNETTWTWSVSSHVIGTSGSTTVFFQ